MSESRSRLADYRSRPPSEQLVDLHIYVVPPDIWRQKHNDVLNTDVNETISAGFIRAHPESKIYSLREDIEHQLGIDLTLKDYVFMKCVGRSLTRVKPKQEYQLKVKNFLPPQAYLPEVYLLEVSPDERQAFGLSSGDGSSRAQTRTSLRHPDRGRYSDDDLSRYNSRERLNVENEKIRNGTYQPGSLLQPGGGRSLNTHKPSSDSVDSSRGLLKSRSSQRPGAGSSTHKLSSDSVDSSRGLLKSRSSQRTRFSSVSITINGKQHSGSSGIGTLLSSQADSELTSRQNNTNTRPLSTVLHSNLPTPNTDSAGKSRRDGSTLPPIATQGRSPPPHMSPNGSPELSPSTARRSHRALHTPRHEDKPPLSATPPPSTESRHRGYDAQPRSDSRTARQERSPEQAYRGDNRRVDSRNHDNAGHRDEERRWRRDQEEARRRERESERRRQEEDLRRWDDERREIQQRLRDEERDREHFDEMERQRLLADEEMRRLIDDAKEQEEEQQKRLEQEEAQRNREFEEAQRRNEEERRQEELRRQEEEAVRRQQEEALQRQQEADDLRRIEAERERLANDNLLKQDTDDQAEEELNRFPSPPPLRMDSPDREVSEEDKKRKKAAKERLQAELEKAREQRRAVERQREELVKKAKQLQTKTQNRRNHARDVWKKRYFEEKKKTFPLDEQSNRLRQELEQIHRRLMSTLEGPKDARGVKVAANSPSEKNNYKIQATRIQHEIEDLKRRVENSKMKLTAEMKLRNQAETELRALRAELTQKKINLTLSRTQQLASLSSNTDLAYMTPRAMVSPRS